MYMDAKAGVLLAFESLVSDAPEGEGRLKNPVSGMFVHCHGLGFRV